MKSYAAMKRQFFTLLSTVALFGFVSPLPGASGFSEPHITVYGKVFNNVTDPPLQGYNGAIEWTFQGPVETLTLTTQMESVANGEFSYKLEIPVEKVPPNFINSPNTVEATTTPQEFAMTVAVDGEPAILALATGAPRTIPLTYAELFRGSFERIDLNFIGEIQDSDGDMMPDYWEQQHAPALDPDDPSDAFDDDDGDGLINVVEFLEDSNPTCYEWMRWLAAHQLLNADPSISGINADPDKDGCDNGMEYALGGDPRTPDIEKTASRMQMSIEKAPDGFDYLTMTIDRPVFRDCHSSFLVQVSSDLEDWKSEEGTDVVTLLSNVQTIKARDSRYLGNNGDEHRYMRVSLRVTP
ncbi:MAG: hypothetical protein AAGJ79_10050 [Verrucomicrobiota bacterium]